MSKTPGIVIRITLLAGSSGLLIAGTTTIGGRVVDSHGLAVDGALVMCWKIPRLALTPGRGTAAFRQGRTTDDFDASGSMLSSGSSGAFLISLPAPTVYLGCANSPTDDLLGTCKWTGPATFALEDGKPQSADFVLQPAGRILVHFKDPEGLLPRTDDPRQPQRLIVGVTTVDGAFHGADRSVPEGDEVTYTLLVPLDTDVNLSIFTRDFRLSGLDGKPVNETFLSSQIRIADGSQSTPREFSFAVAHLQ